MNEKDLYISIASILLISNSIEAIAEEFYREEETAQLSAEFIVETTAFTESSSDIHEIEKNEDSSDRILSEEVNYMTNNSSLKNTNDSTRSLGGQTGRWFVINEQNMFFSPIPNIVKDTISPIVFSKIIAQTSGSSTNISETILFSDTITIQSLPEVTDPNNTAYTIEYLVDKLSFDSIPPNDVTQLKGIKVAFSKMVSSERVEIKNIAMIACGNTNSGINELAQFFEDDRLSSKVYFDSY